MNFFSPNMLLNIFWLLPACLALAFLGGRRRRRRLALFIAEAALADSLSPNVSAGRRRARVVLYLAALLFLLVAAARPYWGTHLVPRPARSRDVMIVLDTSRSMLARDITPSRLAHAKWFVRQLLEQTPGDRYGLIAFAGTAFLECPLTQDRSGFQLFLEDIDTGTIPVGGTNLEAALDAALEAFKAAEGSHRAVLLITDGDQLDGDVDQVLDEFTERNIPIFVVGIGDPELGSYIQTDDNTFITDENGERVRSKLNQRGLKQIVARVGGTYVHSTIAHDGLKPIVQRVRGLVPDQQDETTMSRPIERYQLPLLVAFVLLLARLLIGERKPVSGATVQAGAAMALLLFAVTPGHAQDEAPLVVMPDSAPAPAAAAQPAPAPQMSGQAPALDDQKRALLQRSVERLEARLKDVLSDREKAYLHYNLGVNLQMLGLKDSAISSYNRALELCDNDPELVSGAYQNLGVIEHQQALDSMMNDAKASQEKLRAAQEYYREAMRADPQRQEIAKNQELAIMQRRLLEELQRMQEELKDKHEKAQEAAEQAHEKQQQANQSEDPQEQQQLQQQAQQKTQEAKQAAQELADAARQMGAKQAAEMVEKAAEKLDEAEQDQQQAMDRETPKEEQEQAAEDAEEALRQAAQQLGAEPEQKPGEGEQQTAEGEQSEKPPEDADQQGSAGEQGESDKLEQPEEAQAGDESTEDLEDFDKTQALRILDDALANERDLKQQLKAMQKRQNSQQRGVKRDW